MSDPKTYKNLLDPQGHLTDKGIKAFVTGKLSDIDKANVDEHIATCEMCADAVEGATLLHKENALDTSIESINQKIDERTKPDRRKVIPMWNRYLSAAAVLIVLFGITLVTNQYVLNNSNDGLAEQVTETTDKEESSTPDTEEVYTESSDETVSEETIEVNVDQERTLDKTQDENMDEAPQPADKPESPSISNNVLDKSTPTIIEQNEMEEPSEDTYTFEWQEENDIANGNANTSNDEHDIVNDEFADTEEVTTSKQRSNVDQKKQNIKDEDIESIGSAPKTESDNIYSSGYISTDVAKGPFNDTTLSEYLNNFTLSDSLSNKGVTGIVKVQIVLNTIGWIKSVTIVESLSDDIDAEVIQYLESMPQSLIDKQLLINKGRPFDVKITVP